MIINQNVAKNSIIHNSSLYVPCQIITIFSNEDFRWLFTIFTSPPTSVTEKWISFILKFIKYKAQDPLKVEDNC